MLTTSTAVAKKPSDDQPPKGPATVKVGRDLHQIARSLAGYYDQELGELIDEILRPELLRRQTEMIQEIQRRQKGGE